MYLVVFKHKEYRFDSYDDARSFADVVGVEIVWEVVKVNV